MNKPLTAEGIKQYLSPQSPYRITVVEASPSTNGEVKQRAEAGEPAGFVLIAEGQTEGRGRMGRSFFSPKGSRLYLSVLLRPQGSPREILRITSRAAVAAARAAKQACGQQVQIKWVNDLYRDGKKVCGILTEGAFEGDGRISYAVCGVGFNVFPPEGGFPREISATAGALCDGKMPAIRERLAAAFLEEFQRAAEEPFHLLLKEYRAHSYLTGKRVFSPNGAFSGTPTVLDIDAEGGLILRFDDGHTQTLTGGEVSVSPLL